VLPLFRRYNDVMTIKDRFEIALAKAIAAVGQPPLAMHVCMGTWLEIEDAIPDALNKYDLYLYIDPSLPEGALEFFPEPNPESWT
jgi:hypothetical protein